MGFAGQVFAARIAVGLAVPSANALSRTGGMLAKAAGGIYTALAGKRKAAAAERVASAQKEVDRLAQIANENTASTTARIQQHAASGIQNLESLGKRGAETLRAGGKEAMGSMRAGMGDDGKKLFADMTKSMTPLQKLRKMTENFAGMSEKSQKRAVSRSKEIVKARKDEVDSLKHLLRTENQQLEAMLKDGRSTDKSIAKKKEQIAQTGRLIEEKRLERDAAIDEAEVVRTVSVQAWSSETAIKEENIKVTGELADATADLEEAQEECAEATEDLTKGSADFGAAVTDVANDAVKNFSSILLESVATMSAFYYKLNQNTEALMEFERELINANSVWGETNEVMFAAGEQVTQFGQKYGMSMQNGATGLYQLASAGLSANESTEVLNNTLKLSMAVQGDHNTIAKLTTQTLKGFDMEMSQSAEVTDKFAHAIQKSLIEYEDLSSAVKFALPFFTSTGQSIDQLLGSLQVLTNRALEAGIAGRGLRQALAQFAKHAEENDTAFRKMGISVLDAEGNMKQLTEIAADFAAVVGEETVNNTELLTSLIEDLNVRGATAFIHLVQASDEFSEAVENSANASGELDEMVRVQNESLTSQVQILKNNVQAIFQFSDAAYIGTGYLNEFHMTASKMIEKLQGLIVVEENGTMVLTEFGLAIQEIAVAGMLALEEVLMQVIPVIREFSKEGFLNVDMIRLYTLPLRMVVDLLDRLGPEMTKMLLSFYVMNKILPITTALQITSNLVKMWMMSLVIQEIATKSMLEMVQEKVNIGIMMETIQTGASNVMKSIRAFWDALTLANLWRLIKGTGYYIGVLLAEAAAIWGLALATIKLNYAMMFGWGAIILVIAAVGKLIYDSGVLNDWIEMMTEPGGGLYLWARRFKTLGAVIIEVGEAIWYLIDGVAKLISMVLSVPGKVMDFLSGGGSGTGIPGSMRATGGYLTPMQSGGYIVGERGPELFKPSQGGQLLNNTATNHIMQQSADSGFSGGGGNMTVTSLTVENAEMNQSNLNIDSFAGNPAMRRAV
tara:strand:- start:7398 stop:10448 length:3051 start_codon:yes stop_codon:yes gene_type:complete